MNNINLTPEQKLSNIYMSMRRVELSKAQAAKIVGSRYRLEKLVKEKRIRYNQTGTRQNSVWKVNGEDVMRHAKDYLS